MARSPIALLTDIITHLNTLNLKLQGKDILVTDMHAHITAFKLELRLWQAQSANGQAAVFKHFTAPLTFPWTTHLPPADGVGRATVK